ncbi:UNVERIFIED_CONTAM: hypothetical protein NY100_20130, partial [Prevotella sp. 15_C9]
QWGVYANNPLVVERGYSVQEAMRNDPPANGKGGGKLDGKIWRKFPSPRVCTSFRGQQSFNANERRSVLAG